MRISDWSSDVCSSDLFTPQRRPSPSVVLYFPALPRTVSRGFIIERFLTRLVTNRSEEHTSELQSIMRSSYAVFCLKKKIRYNTSNSSEHHIVLAYHTQKVTHLHSGNQLAPEMRTYH